MRCSKRMTAALVTSAPIGDRTAFILAFPLTSTMSSPTIRLWWWLGISFVQTFVIIPLLIYKWGKGAYCGWICSCGALAETMGDAHRQKMPHGPIWNRVNMVGQAALLFAFVTLAFRALGWALDARHPGADSWATHTYKNLFEDIPFLNYSWKRRHPDGGILGVGLYFWFSGRVWCRFACPLAALMHIYARFSRFRILADKKKCISCNVCTSVCHQGDRRDELREQGDAHGGPGVRTVQRVRAIVPDGRADVWRSRSQDRQGCCEPIGCRRRRWQMVELRHNGKVVSA